MLSSQTEVEVPASLPQVAEFNHTERSLNELRGRYRSVVFPVKTDEGLQEAKDGRNELRSLRVALEEKRVELKAPLLERGRIIDAEAKRITTEIVQLEEPITLVIKDEEARRAAEKAEAERIEVARKAAIRAKINAMGSMTVIGKSSAEIQAVIDDLKSLVVDKTTFAECASEAKLVRDVTLTALQNAHDAQLAFEAEQARQKAEREAQEAALRVQQAEQARLEAERQAAIAEERRKLDAEREAHEATVRAQRAEQARLEAERQAAEQPVVTGTATASETPVVATDEEAASPDLTQIERDAIEQLISFRKTFAGIVRLSGVMHAIDELIALA